MIGKSILLFFLLLADALAVEAHRFVRDVVIVDASRQNLIAVPLDAAIYKVNADDFHDLRLTDQDGVETPYMLQKMANQKRVSHRLPSASHKPVLRTSGDNGIEITVKLDENSVEADGLTVVTNQHDFEYELQVQGSYDGQKWQVLVDHVLIYDYARFMDVGNRDVTLPGNRFRQFKIVVSQAVQSRSSELMELTQTLRGTRELQRNEKIDVHREPLRIERIDLWHNQIDTVADSEQMFDYPLAGFSVSQDGEHKTTVVDIKTDHPPLTALSLDIATLMFSRRVEVQIPMQLGVETRMQTIAIDSLSGLRFQDINHSNTTLHFAEQRRPNYRLVIYNQDSPPLEITSVTGRGPGYQLLFINKPGSHYQLNYAADNVHLPSYDVAQIRELLRQGYVATVASLGPETMVNSVENGWNLAGLLNSKLFLVLVIGLMVLVLGWSLYQVGKRVADIAE